jgi:serine/threonine protein phosphatase 1
MQTARRVAEKPASTAANDKFAIIRRATRVWAVSAIHGQVDRLVGLHTVLNDRFESGDRLVYLGNYLGGGPNVAATIEELLYFRRAIISRPRMFASDVVYLRGSQEEMWQKLLQLQFAVNARDVLEWMLQQGLAATIRDYGGDPERGRSAMREGPMAIGRWTESLRQGMGARPGHRALVSALRRAAHTDDHGLLFVHAGIDPSQPLSAQGDALWWGHANWRRIAAPYEGFKLVVRGFARGAAQTMDGLEVGAYTLTVDGKCGSGGPLVAVCLSPDGEILDRLEA